jgi:hypothetical protein
MLCPIHPQRQAAAVQAVRAASHDYDPGLLKPVCFIAPPAGLHPAERARLESEKACLLRELSTTQRGIDRLTDLLAA